MRVELSVEHTAFRKEVRQFITKEVRPAVNECERIGTVPRDLIRKMGEMGYLGATIPVQHGGRGLDQISYGLLSEEIGRESASIQSLVTVQSALVASTILRWGTDQQKERWLPLLAKGEKIAAFALSEAEAGSDAKNVQTQYQEAGDQYLISGCKRWTSFAQIADVFLTFAQGNKGVSAFLVERDTSGLVIEPIEGMLGMRASMLGNVHMKECCVRKEAILGQKGFGFLQIANTALDNGRFSVAWSSLGLLQACLQDSINHIRQRTQFGSPLKVYQLIKQKVAEMVTDANAARMLCYTAALMRDKGNYNAIIHTAIAKNYAATAANRAANHAVQIHGAQGCHASSPIERYFRDARIFQIIEGTTEMQELLIADEAINSLSETLIFG